MTGQGVAAHITGLAQGEGGAAHPAVPYGSMEGTTFISVRFLTHHLYDRFDQR